MKQFLPTLLFGAAATAILSSGACQKETVNEVQPICEAGKSTFCRCPGSFERGTQTCKADGSGFEECVTEFGPCPEVPDTTASAGGDRPTTTGTGGQGGAGGAGGGGDGGAATTGSGAGPTGTLALHEPCGKSSDCKSGLCAMGYCTLKCDSSSQCTKGSCVHVDNSLVDLQVCAPHCTDNLLDCVDPYKNPSQCGYTPTTEGTKVAVCADWAEKLELPPDGTECGDGIDSDLRCNLGHEGRERICLFGGCTEGCWTALDCPPEAPKCSGKGGAPGTCGAP